MKNMKVETLTYNGQLDHKVFFDWLDIIEQYFDWYEISDDQWIRFAKMKLAQAEMS